MFNNLLTYARFFRRYRYVPNLANPTTAAEKLLYRMLFGNHETYASLTDKYNVREFVEQRVGSECLIPLYGVFPRLSSETLAGLPNSFALKANHGCKWNLLVKDKSQIDFEKTTKYFNQLVTQRYGKRSGEQHYRLIEPCLIAEQLLDIDGSPPWNYCYFCYWHAGQYQSTVSIHSADRTKTAHFSPALELLEATNIADSEIPHLFNRDIHEQVEPVARSLSEGFDFVRVDLYYFDGKVKFSELTFTPNAGARPIADPIRRRLRDTMWVLDKENPYLYKSRLAA